MISEIILNGQKINYDFQRKNVKNINIRIKADQTVYVSANNTIPKEAVEELLRAKSEYIIGALKKYGEIAEYAAKHKQYVDGETFFYLGHELRLKVCQGKKNTVSSDGKNLTLTIKDPCDLAMKKRCMDKWYKLQCKAVISSVCKTIYPKFRKYGVDYPDLKFRNMVSRWGSCQPKRGSLTFNIALVESPMACIEYVVTHEFTHFLHPNHSKEFYKTLSMFMPDWRERKNILEKSNTYLY